MYKEEYKNENLKSNFNFIGLDPSIANEYFYYRIEQIKVYLKKTLGMTDYIIRYEFQSRGTVHAHCLFWGLIHFERENLLKIF